MGRLQHGSRHFNTISPERKPHVSQWKDDREIEEYVLEYFSADIGFLDSGVTKICLAP